MWFSSLLYFRHMAFRVSFISFQLLTSLRHLPAYTGFCNFTLSKFGHTSSLCGWWVVSIIAFFAKSKMANIFLLWWLFLGTYQSSPAYSSIILSSEVVDVVSRVLSVSSKKQQTFKGKFLILKDSNRSKNEIESSYWHFTCLKLMGEKVKDSSRLKLCKLVFAYKVLSLMIPPFSKSFTLIACLLIRSSVWINYYYLIWCAFSMIYEVNNKTYKGKLLISKTATDLRKKLNQVIGIFHA